ncbi:hypothetical protein TRAPUB_6780 [Trametes pubescens]|uniref:Uncharacterized protein n=1 Tax=Trametes pubescens TaxID=154538 RepID=A0A1M2V509_TRAPU|nr:hypothetical protein TRAPUB_6780 [Trametes pubescens]
MGLGNGMHGHRIHPRQEVTAKWLRIAAKADFLHALLAKEILGLGIIWRWSLLVPGIWVEIRLRVSEGPETSVQAPEDRSNKGLIRMVKRSLCIAHGTHIRQRGMVERHK